MNRQEWRIFLVGGCCGVIFTVLFLLAVAAVIP